MKAWASHKQTGFTIVELLIVIVVIGILAALVLNTFAGIQQRARDTERKTDIKAVATQLEAYYALEGHYPHSQQINFSAGYNWVETNMPGLDRGALTAPGVASGTSSFTQLTSPSTSQYAYRPLTELGALCNTAGGFTASDCESFILYYRSEQDNTVKQFPSLN